MPPLPDVTGALRVEFRISDNASIDAGSRFFLSYSGPAPDTGDLNTLAAAVATAWNGNMPAVVLEGESLVEVICTDLSSSSGAQGVWSGSHGGSLSGSALPSSACALINHQISRRYRGGRPRNYHRAGSTGVLDGTNRWTTDFQGDVLTAWQGWIAAVLAVTGISITLENIINISYYESFLPFETPSGRYKNISQLRKVDGTPAPLVGTIVASTVNIKLGSQRRRLNA